MPDPNSDFRGHSRGQGATVRMLEGTFEADGVTAAFSVPAAQRPPAYALILAAVARTEVTLTVAASYTLGDSDADRHAASPGAGAELVKDYLMAAPTAAMPAMSATPYTLIATFNAAPVLGRLRWTLYFIELTPPVVFNAGT